MLQTQLPRVSSPETTATNTASMLAMPLDQASVSVDRLLSLFMAQHISQQELQQPLHPKPLLLETSTT